MKHIITNEIKNKIGKQIVFGNIKDGGKINLSVKDDKIIFGGIDED
jgi:ATP-dependent Clp protease ATP-binding subunit ClpA